MIRLLAIAGRAHRRLTDLVTLTVISLAFAPAAYASGSPRRQRQRAAGPHRPH